MKKYGIRPKRRNILYRMVTDITNGEHQKTETSFKYWKKKKACQPRNLYLAKNLLKMQYFFIKINKGCDANRPILQGLLNEVF